MFLAIKVIPKAHQSEIVGWENEALKIRLKAVPEKGEANNELIALLSKILGISKSRIELVSGFTSRQKKVKIHDFSEEALKNKINLL
ncbi:MAG: DUF167 domain-containing protein [Parachlamydiaceae bacterium]